jgi:type II secretory pathway pseudopilin PulG
MFMTEETSQGNSEGFIAEHKSKVKVFRPGERSFSLVETVVAVSLIAYLMLEVSGVHGNAINFADYSRKSMQAIFLAKRLMSQVEYQASQRTPLKELAINERERPFEDAPDFQYSMTVEPLPNSLDLMFKVVSGGLIGDASDDQESGEKNDVAAMLEQVKGMIEAAVGEEPIWMANVSVSWVEGARRPSVDLAMIITDIKKLEATLNPLIAKAPKTPNPSAPQSIPSNAGRPPTLPPPVPPPAPPN